MSTHSLSPILESIFRTSVSNPELSLTRYLKSIHGPKSQLVSTLTHAEASFPLTEYLESIGIHPSLDRDESHFTFDFDSAKGKQTVEPRILAGIVQFIYAQTSFRVYIASWTTGYNDFYFYGLVFTASNDQIGKTLASEVYRYANVLKQEIWVYEGGMWVKNKTLYQAIQATQWDDVVLSEHFKDGLRRDTQTFFESKDVYDSLSMTWKRGILLLGPPGNGKTESIKALIHESGRDALYVKSFTTPYVRSFYINLVHTSLTSIQGPEHGIRTIFSHARKHAPCMLILEDLDSMVTPKVRSYLLNELDGLVSFSPNSCCHLSAQMMMCVTGAK